MDIGAIERKIERSLQHERAYGVVRQTLRSTVALAGARLSPRDEQQALDFIVEYVRHVPHLLREAQEAASEQGVSEMDRILQSAVSYWAAEVDLIPDHLGLLGVLDDAYCTLALLQGFSNRCKKATGTALLATDFTVANLAMRGLLGEPAASLLDNHVAQQLGGQDLDQVVAALGELLGSVGPFVAAGPDPIWGNASPSEIANTRLGALGVV